MIPVHIQMEQPLILRVFVQNKSLISAISVLSSPIKEQNMPSLGYQAQSVVLCVYRTEHVDFIYKKRNAHAHVCVWVCFPLQALSVSVTVTELSPWSPSFLSLPWDALPYSCTSVHLLSVH